MTTNETIGCWILTAFLVWLDLHYWVLPAKIADTLGKLIMAAFVIWILGNITHAWAAQVWTQVFTIWQVALLAMAGVALFLFRRKRGNQL
jgi:hypothetical protein